MAHDAFISYALRDRPTADAVCAALEGQGIRCWIAPRDVPAGVPWGQSIVEAIQSSRLLVLVFSAAANDSPQVMREVERAVDRRVPILPLRIEEVQPSGSMEYFLRSIHWLDALTPPLEDHLRPLAEAAQSLLARGRDEQVQVPCAAVAAGDKVRARFLKSVKEDVENRLRVSIHNARFIDLGIDVAPTATHLPWVYKDPDSSQEFRQVEDAFAFYHRRLLLLGAPGAGKTTTLLHLARQLIAEAERDPAAPVPLLVNLSQFRLDEAAPSHPARWLRHRPTEEERDRRLERWLVGELTRRPGISTEVARRWIEEDRVAVLMDGLDEADTESRADLVRLLNATFLHKHPDAVAVVCSRVNDYRPLQSSKETRLQLDGAVTLQLLTTEQIESYLDAARATGLRAALPNDAALYEMAQTPLTLSMMTLAYGGQAPTDLPEDLSLTQRRHHLMEAYVARMLQRKERRDRGIPFDQCRDNDVPERDYRYSPKQVDRYLGWLAVHLSVRIRATFSLERFYGFLAGEKGFGWQPAITRYIHTTELLVALLNFMLGVLELAVLFGVPVLFVALNHYPVSRAVVCSSLLVTLLARRILKGRLTSVSERMVLSPAIWSLISLTGRLPIRLASFIGYATDSLLLKRSAGDVEFMHRLLRDYFALRDLQPLLSERNLDRCLEAIRDLVFLGESAIDSLAEFARDQDPRVREAAISELGKIESPQVFRHIVAALGDPSLSVRKAAFAWLMLFREQDYQRIVRGTFWGADEDLGRFDDGLAIEPLLMALANREGFVRVAAAEALGQLGDARAVEPLQQALEDPVEVVRYAAALALDRLGRAPS